MPQALAAIIDRAMDADPQKRFANASELAEAIETVMTRSVIRERSTLLQALTQVISFAALLVLLAGSLLIWRLLPPRDQGFVAYFFVSQTVASVGLSLLQWRSAGRYHLSALTLALASSTVLLGLAATSMGVVQLMRHLGTKPLLADALAYKRAFRLGLGVASSTLASSASFAALQIVLWATVRRALALKSEHAAKD